MGDFFLLFCWIFFFFFSSNEHVFLLIKNIKVSLSPVTHNPKLQCCVKGWCSTSLKFNYNLNSVLIFVCAFSSYLVTKLYKLYKVNVAWLWFQSSTSQQRCFTLKIKGRADINILKGLFLKWKKKIFFLNALYLYQITVSWKSQVA